MSWLKKYKSDIVFGVVAILLFAFFFSPLWSNLYNYLISLSLKAPNIEKHIVSEENFYFDHDWTVYRTNGSEFSIQETEKPIFINFFATWCSPCVSEFPSIVELYKQFKNKVEFIIVSPDEELSKIKKFEAYHNFSLPFYSSNSTLPYGISINSYPTTYLIDKNKKMILEIKGAHDWNSKNVANFLNRLIKE